jgi:hypothetical protein
MLQAGQAEAPTYNGIWSSLVPQPPIVLGIETSCDETAAAVVDGARRILANVVLSQLEDHRPYGGVVPEIAARAHVLHLDGLIDRAMAEAGIGFGDLSAIAATAGPGLIGGVMVGLTTGKALAAITILDRKSATIKRKSDLAPCTIKIHGQFERRTLGLPL